MSVLTPDRLDETATTPRKARRGILRTVTTLAAAGIVAVAGSGVAHAAPITSGEFDFVSARIVGSSWQLGSYDHGTEQPISTPADGWQVPASQNNLIPADDGGNPTIYPLSGGGLRNETGTAAKLTLYSVSHPGTGTGQLTIKLPGTTGATKYKWTETGGVVTNNTALPANFHDHYNWQFGADGVYYVTFKVESASGTTPTVAYKTYKFDVK
ncbi:MAG: hypothetical protein QM708_12300 [Propioniciclava sp.]|uniref:hypothetical protein n=1 Tax=Propioniciclava sp. TaxID=2038686 RepID=UPI0039E3A23A